MARPTQAKEVKPKAEGGEEEAAASGGGGGGVNSGMIGMIIMAVIIVICSSVASAASVYFLAPMVIKPLLAEMKPAAEGGEEGGGEEGGGEGGEGGEKAPTVGPVVALDEFTVNLKDPGGQRYLRASLSLTVTPEDPEFDKLTGEAMKKWEEEFHIEMGHYVPAIRDIVITALTKRNASELSTAMGKEELKTEIKTAADALFHGHRKVIRVNLENFIIQ